MRGIKQMKLRRVIVLFFAVCVLAVSTQAQYVRPTNGGTYREFTFNNPMSALAATMVMNKAREDALARRLGARPSAGQSSGNTSAAAVQSRPQSQLPSKKIDESILRFRSTGTYLKTRELADQIGGNPTERETILKIMNATLDAFRQKTQPLGLQNDIAAALAFFFGENIRIYRSAPELPDQQYLNLRKMIAGALTASDGFVQATDRQKQEMYEVLVAATGFTQFAYEQAMQANRPDLARTYQQVAGSNLQSLTKLSPDNLNLTDDGLTVATSIHAGAPPNGPELGGVCNSGD
jgi:hypothetical protein